MSKFRKSIDAKHMPEVSTASLPDIIFLLLFFFMIVGSTKVGNHDQFIILNKPTAENLTRLAPKKDLLMYLYIGKPQAVYQSLWGSGSVLLINDKQSELSSIEGYVQSMRSNIAPELHTEMTTHISFDKDVELSQLQDIKDKLIFMQSYKVSYAAKRGNVLDNFR